MNKVINTLSDIKETLCTLSEALVTIFSRRLHIKNTLHKNDSTFLPDAPDKENFDIHTEHSGVYILRDVNETNQNQ